MLSLDKDWNLGKEDCGACPNSCQSLLLTSSGVRTSEKGLLEASDLSLLSLAALLNLFPCNAILWMTLRAVVLFDVSKASSWLSLYRAKNFKKTSYQKTKSSSLSVWICTFGAMSNLHLYYKNPLSAMWKWK